MMSTVPAQHPRLTPRHGALPWLAHSTPEPDIAPVPDNEPTPAEAPHVDPDPSEVPQRDPVPVQDPMPHQVPIRAR